jgi:hypothetical protein
MVMDKKIGKVIEVFIPEEYKGDRLIDVMDSNKIGFKVMLEDEVIEVIEEQNEYNVKIMKNDLVVITKQNISNTDFIDIELYDGDSYE